MKILAISDVASTALWSPQCRERLEGIDLILSCGDLPRAYLEFLTNFTPAPILYVHGNHDEAYAEQEPDAALRVADPILNAMTPDQLRKSIERTRRLMQDAAKKLEFIEAAQYRDELLRLEDLLKERTR